MEPTRESGEYASVPAFPPSHLSPTSSCVYSWAYGCAWGRVYIPTNLYAHTPSMCIACVHLTDRTDHVVVSDIPFIWAF